MKPRFNMHTENPGTDTRGFASSGKHSRVKVLVSRSGQSTSMFVYKIPNLQGERERERELTLGAHNTSGCKEHLQFVKLLGEPGYAGCVAPVANRTTFPICPPKLKQEDVPLPIPSNLCHGKGHAQVQWHVLRFPSYFKSTCQGSRCSWSSTGQRDAQRPGSSFENGTEGLLDP